VDGQFSIPYTVAVALQRGKVTLEDFEEEVVRQTYSSELAKKVTVQVDKAFAKQTTQVNIQMKSGKTFSKKIDYFKGHPRNPFSREEFLEKFRNCARFAAVPVGAERADQMLKALQEIENIKNVREITQLFT